jgi:hypothetical protein
MLVVQKHILKIRAIAIMGCGEIPHWPSLTVVCSASLAQKNRFFKHLQNLARVPQLAGRA